MDEDDTFMAATPIIKLDLGRVILIAFPNKSDMQKAL